MWEESIIFLPLAIKMFFLSVTMSNAMELAKWICKLHAYAFHVIYTNFRPASLQHYVFSVGGFGMYLVVNKKEGFREYNFLKAHESFTNKILDDGLDLPRDGLHENEKHG